MKVLVVIITADKVEKRCRASVLNQTYKGYEVMIYTKPAEVLHKDPVCNLYLNCSRTREEARQKALNGDHTHFLFMDSDIVIPSDAIEEFVRQSKPVKVPTFVALEPGEKYKGPIPMVPGVPIPGRMVQKDRSPNRILGGWYTMRNDPSRRWVAGKWIEDNVFMNYGAPERSLVEAAVVGLGCAFMPRAAVEQIPFRHGIDEKCLTAWGLNEIILGECGAFGNDALDAGFELWMDGDVICEHLEREK